MNPVSQEVLANAAAAIKHAKSLIVTAGAGMGVDSGLPSFRDDQGFWNAYPEYQKLGMNFMNIANPRHFAEDPQLGWGFYGHRANLYRGAQPHEGFAIILDWIKRFDLPWFVVTSNVDGQFQKAGFDEERVVEVHGSIHHMQCMGPCLPHIWPHDEVFDINMSNMRSQTIPKCPHCGHTARPNILMFGDFQWIPTRSNAQQRRFERFLDGCPKPITVVEIGAGRAIPTIRREGEKLARVHGGIVVRINPREPEIDAPHILMPAAGAFTLAEVNKLLK